MAKPIWLVAGITGIAPVRRGDGIICYPRVGDGNRLSFFLNTGQRDSGGMPVFVAAGGIPRPKGAWEASRVDDLNGDGAVDLVVGDHYLRNTNAAGWPFEPTAPVPLNAGMRACFLDLDDDGLLDLIYSCAGSTPKGSIYLMRNVGTKEQPAFHPPRTLSCFGEPIYVTAHGPHPWVGDLDGDDKPDVVTCVEWSVYHFYGPTRRTIYVVHTNTDLIGLGESGSREPDAVLAKYVGSNPFDWIGDETSLGLGIAMYDLMGQAAGVPVYKLFGQKYRSWVPAAAWTVSTHPQRMAKAVQEFSARGYTWMKYHLSPFENVIDQMDAMQAVAPKGFRIHHDLTMGGTDDNTFELLEKISKYPIAGGFEDPLPEKDIEGYTELRKKCRLPIYYHHAPLGAGFETQRRSADGYILGHAKIGDAIRRAGLFAQLELPFSLQNVGGTIMRAMTVHMQAAFKTAHLHFNSDTETWTADVVSERLEPVNGLIRLPERPGLGLTLDRAELERLKNLKLPEQPKWIIRTRYTNGTMMYNIADPLDSLFMVRPDNRRLVTLSYDAPLTTEYWDPDGTPAFRDMFQRLEKEGMVLERPFK